MGLKDEVLTVLREYLAVDVHADEWDEPPSLSIIIRGTDGVPNFERMPVSLDAWEAAPVHKVLWATTQVTRMATERGWQWTDPGEEILGVALFSEGWGVSQKTPGPEVDALAAYMDAGGRLADHPLGVECKMVNAVLMPDGEIVMLTHFRSGEQVDPNDGGDLSGRIPDALRDLLRAFQPKP
jgi:hypothetical protein